MLIPDTIRELSCYLLSDGILSLLSALPHPNPRVVLTRLRLAVLLSPAALPLAIFRKHAESRDCQL